MKTTAPNDTLDSDLATLSAPHRAGGLENEFIRPAEKFKHLELHPYTKGADLVWHQLCHRGDNGITKALKFVFMLVKRGGATMTEDFARHLIPLAWRGSDEINLALFEWAAEHIKSDDDLLAAITLHEKMTAAAQASAVDLVGGGKKKRAARSRTKRRS
jgi:hypothetical protein